MRFQQVRDLLDHARLFHRDLSKFYKSLASNEESERVKLLLDYLGRHEKHLEESLSAYEDDAPTQVLNSWFQFTLDESTLKTPESIQIKPHMTIADVIRMSLSLDDRLIKVYKNIAKTAEVPEVREVFENLLQMEEKEKHTLARAALNSMDL